MTAPFVPGELVVCVDASACPDERLHVGAIYTIKECVCDPHAGWGGVGPSPHQRSKWSVGIREIPLEITFYRVGTSLEIHYIRFAATRFDKYRPEHSLDETDQRKEVHA
jgi:hypothetical protein